VNLPLVVPTLKKVAFEKRYGSETMGRKMPVVARTLDGTYGSTALVQERRSAIKKRHPLSRMPLK